MAIYEGKYKLGSVSTQAEKVTAQTDKEKSAGFKMAL